MRDKIGRFEKGHTPSNKGKGIKKYCKICGTLMNGNKRGYKTYCSWVCYLSDPKKKTIKGKATSKKIRIKQSCVKREIDIKDFVGFLRAINKQIRNLNEYKEWRYKIFKRDDFICQMCDKSKCYLEAHHLDRLSNIIKEHNIDSIYDAKKCGVLWDINNGITLCKKCHNKIHSEDL